MSDNGAHEGIAVLGVEERLQARFLQPIQEELDQALAEREALRAQLAAVDSAVRRLEKFRNALDPTAMPVKAPGKAGVTEKIGRSEISRQRTLAALVWIQNHPMFTSPEIRNALGWNDATTSNHLKLLREKEIVRLAGTRKGETGRTVKAYKVMPPFVDGFDADLVTGSIYA